MSMYREIKSPTEEEICARISSWTYHAAMCQSLDAYLDGAIDAGVYDKLYAKCKELAKGVCDNSVNIGEDKPLTSKDGAVYTMRVEGMEPIDEGDAVRRVWDLMIKQLIFEHPLNIVSLMCHHCFFMHYELEDCIAKRLLDLDKNYRAPGIKPTTQLNMLLSAYFLSTNKDCALELVKSWTKEMQKPTKKRPMKNTCKRFPEIKSRFFAMMNDFFSMMLATEQDEEEGMPVPLLAFACFAYGSRTKSIFFPDITAETYGRYYDE